LRLGAWARLGTRGSASSPKPQASSPKPPYGFLNANRTVMFMTTGTATPLSRVGE
jgi:hypothetical protein